MTGPGGDKPDALLLDEMFSPAIADGLAARGIDCRAAVADALLRALSDLEIFETALLEGRVIVTKTCRLREPPAGPRRRRGSDPGLIYTSDVTFPRTKAYVARLVTALADAPPGARRPGTAACCGCTRPADLWIGHVGCRCMM